jgi:hypothetical protein
MFMNNFTKCCSSAKGLQKKGITTLMLFMFLALTSLSYGQGLGVDPLGGGEEIGDINECMHDVPAMKSVADLMVPGYFNGYFDACQGSNDFVIHPVAADYGSDNPNMPQAFNGEWGKKTGFSKGSTHCNWIFYYVYSVKCAGEVTPFTVKYSGGDATAPSVPKANKAAYNALVADKLDLNLCFDDRPTAPTAEQIAALYTDNCDHVKVSGELVSKRTKTKNDDCGWTEIHVYTVQDYCESNAFEFSITYTGSDHDAPVFNQKAIEGLKDITVDCDKIPDAVSIPYTDNCAPNGKAKLYDEVSTIVKGEECAGGTIERWWKATDECGNNAWHKQTITVRPALQAQFNEPQDMSISCEDKNNLESLIPDLYYTNGMQGDCNISGTAKPQYTATDLDCGSFLVEYFFTDACGRVSKEEMTVTIFDDKNPVVLNAAENLTVECDGAGNMEEYMNWVNNNANASAEDNCTATEDLVWTNNAASQPMSDDCGETGQKTVIFTVTDSCGNQSKTYATFKIVDTLDPVYTPAYNQTVVCDGAGNVDQFQVWLDDNAGATAKDDCSGVTWTNDFPGNPKSKDFDITQYLVDGCSTYTGYINVTFTATDACGNDIQTAATFTIEDSIKPEMTPASDMTVECDGTIPDIWKIGVEYAQDALDAQQGVFYPGTNAYAAYMWLKSHGGATATDGCSNVNWKFKIIGVYGDSCDTEYKVTFYAYDDCLNVSSSTATFHIEDTNSPAIGNEAQDLVVECGANDVTCSIVAGPHSPFDHWLHTNAGAEAMDMCDKTLTWSNDYDGKGLTDECGATGRVTVTFTVTDNCGLSSSTAAEYRIEDTTAPILQIPADYATVYDATCNADITPEGQAGIAEGWDTCSDDVTISHVDVTDKTACTTVVTRTWTATDACGNKTSANQIITISDETAPILVGNPNTLNKSNVDACEAPAGPSLAEVEALFSDNCYTPIAKLVNTNVIKDEICGWTTSFEYTIEDRCGNMYLDGGFFKVIYFGKDQTAPVLNGALPKGESGLNLCYDDAVDAHPGADPLLVALEFKDDCDTAKLTVEKTFVDDRDFVKYPNGCTWAFHYNFKVYDACGNYYEFNQEFNGQDKQAPRLNDGVDLNALNQSNLDLCKEDAPAGPTTAYIASLFTECGLSPNGVIVNGVDGGTNDSAQGYDIGAEDCDWMFMYEYTITDKCGNEAPESPLKVFISGRDQTAPVLNVPNKSYQSWYSVRGICPTDATIGLTVGQVLTTSEEFVFAGWPVNFEYTQPSDNCTAYADIRFRVLSITPGGDSCEKTFTVEYEALDNCNNKTAVYTKTYATKDNIAPTASAPADITVQCADDVPAVDVSLITDEADNCQTPTVTHEGDVSDGGFPVENITRSYRVADGCGNFIIVSHNIKIEDTIAPVIECSGDIVVQAGSSVAPTTVVRNYAGRTVTFNNINVNGTGAASAIVAPGSPVTVTTDWNSQYTSTYCPGCVTQYYIGVKDLAIDCMWNGGTAYSINGQSGSLSFTAPATPGVYVVQFGGSLQYSCTTTAGQISDSGIGALAYIYVAPPLTGSPVYYDASIYADNCDPNPSINLVKGLASGEIFPTGDTLVTYEVTDASGNTATCSFVVTVEDPTAAPPVAAAPVDEASLDFKAYPVPFNSDVTVKYNFEFDTDVTVEVYDTKGLLVLSKKAAYKAGGDATMPLRINGADQMYYVKLITNKGTITKKVLASKL